MIGQDLTWMIRRSNWFKYTCRKQLQAFMVMDAGRDVNLSPVETWGKTKKYEFFYYCDIKNNKICSCFYAVHLFLSLQYSITPLPTPIHKYFKHATELLSLGMSGFELVLFVFGQRVNETPGISGDEREGVELSLWPCSTVDSLMTGLLLRIALCGFTQIERGQWD